MKKLLIIAMALILMWSLCACVRTDTNIAHYPDHVEEYQAGMFMPALENIGEYQSVEYRCRKDHGLFPAFSMQLVVKYGEDVFTAEKERLESAYTYLDDAVKYEDGDYRIPIAEFTCNGMDFKITKFEDTNYPKNFGMVGISNEKMEIAYLWFYSQDQDYICEANENQLKGMNEFIEEYFSLE